jgi:hypothetical protein
MAGRAGARFGPWHDDVGQSTFFVFFVPFLVQESA